MKRQWKNDLWSDHPEIQFGPIIFSFKTMNPGLYYVPEKSILIKRGYLDWRAFSLRKFFVINEGCGLLSSAKILDKPFTCSGWIFKCIIGQSKQKKKWKKKNDSRVKIRKGGLEQKRESFQKLMGRANRKMEGQRPDSIRNLYEVLYPSQNQKFKLFVPECLPSNSRTYHGGSWRLSNCHIQEQQKWIFLRCLIFKEFIFQKKKRLWNCTVFLLNQIVEISPLS